jgi:hypothetical protein
MPTAKKDAAPKTATVTEKIIRTEQRDPIEIEVTEPRVPVSPKEDFWRYIKSLTDEDWKNHHVTLYRYPLGQPKPDKLGRYVKTYKHGNPLLSEEQIYEEFGGSQYTAMLKGPRDGQPWFLIATHSWEMDGPQKNPWQVSSGGGGVAVANSDLASTLQVVLDKLSAAQRSGSPAADPAVKESISLIQQLTSAFKPQGINELVAGVAALQKLSGGDGGGNLRDTLSLLKEFGALGGERHSLAQELKEILEIAGLMGTGGGGGGRKDWATALVENLPGILEKVTPIADKFADAARANARVAEIRAGGRPGPVIPVSQTVPAALPRPAGDTPPPVESPAPRTVTAPETEPVDAQVRPPNLVWVKAKAVQMFLEGKPGDLIAEFLDQLDRELGAFLGSMNREQFKQFVETDAILKQIAGAPRFPAFVADFVDYFSEVEEGDGDTDKTPVSAQAS